MKKTWEDIVRERGDQSYKPGKNQKVNFPRGVRPPADSTSDTDDTPCVDSGRSQGGLRANEKTAEQQPSTQLLRVPGIGPSLNEYGRSTRGKRQSGKLVSAWNQKVKILAREQGLRTVQNYPVQIVVECYFGDGRKRFDWDNLSPTPKLIQDGLVHAGILRNDSAPYVESGTMKALKTKGESYTLFMIIEPARKAA